MEKSKTRLRILSVVIPVSYFKVKAQPNCEAVNELQAGEEGKNGAVI